jgi:hypothetical protein
MLILLCGFFTERMEWCYLCLMLTMAWWRGEHQRRRPLGNLVESIFEISKLGEPLDLLGIEIQRNRGAGTSTLTQRQRRRNWLMCMGFRRHARQC